jgi:hypothetical protein
LVDDLPWLAARSGNFVPEFWRAVSPPATLVAKAVRRIALEENLQSGAVKIDESVERTWKCLTASIGAESPILARLLQAVRHESEPCVDMPLLLFWKDSRGGDAAAEMELMAQLLLLASLMCVMADATASNESPGPTESGTTAWAVNAMTLGAVDMVVAHYFAHAARVPASVSAECTRLLSHAIRSLPGCRHHVSDPKHLDESLRTLAMGFKQAARSCVATAA